ncbi:FecR family protein [Chitinophaga jiangningensis]|uniref:FecR family protein n=1 Tax=Chitinophaga jiangningensis TaxID=1419482 RepID=A0A1M6WQK5_9BACT|nr:FecR family protein [Chitinophaga jiangningensis]SHK95869.1 FecR family protein [Chitinophaga jiangningensis]
MIPSFSDEALYTLLCKYLLDEADGEERAWVDNWLTAHADNRQLLDALRKVLDTAAAKQYTIQADTGASWQRLYQQLDVPETPARLRPVRSFSWKVFARVAAVLLLLIGAGTWYLATRPAEKYAGPLQATLLDGSKIELKGKASTLHVAKGFNDKNRKVSLKGSAAFDVAANPDQPFIVSLGRTEVKVLGTRFTVNYQPDSAILEVHVSSGKVMVIDHVRVDSVVLTEGMLLQQDAARQDFRIATHVLDPVQKSLVFQDVPLEEVLQTITVLYDVRVIVENTALLKFTVKTNLNGASIEEVMESLALSVGAEWKQTGPRQYRLK